MHDNDYAAKLQGAQGAYDVGIQRTRWQIHPLTNWMGDAGFLTSVTSQYRSHVYLADMVRLGGRWRPRRSTPAEPRGTADDVGAQPAGAGGDARHAVIALPYRRYR